MNFSCTFVQWPITRILAKREIQQQNRFSLETNYCGVQERINFEMVTNLNVVTGLKILFSVSLEALGHSDRMRTKDPDG